MSTHAKSGTPKHSFEKAATLMVKERSVGQDGDWTKMAMEYCWNMLMLLLFLLVPLPNHPCPVTPGQPPLASHP